MAGIRTGKASLDWLADRLERDYEFLTAREYGPDAAAQLICGDYLTVILDGLDEIPEGLRPAALRALDEQATFRLVVLTRSDELVTAVSGAHLTGAAALELCPVEPRQAAEYLAHCQIDSPSSAWQRLIEHLREHPDSMLAQALGAPLMVTLVRDTYRHGDPVDALIDSTRFASREAIEDHLLDRVLPIAYAQHPGRPAAPCTVDEARQRLGFLARHMNDEGTRDLAWWQIPRWVPAWPRALTTALVVGLVGELVFGLRGGLVFGLANGLTSGLVYGLGNGVDYGLVFKVGLKASLLAAFVGILTNALTFGLGVVLASSTTWTATLASAQLRRRGETPVRLLNFLEDAHAREVLRCVGPIYQFRHARLQDRLAGVCEEIPLVQPPQAVHANSRGPMLR